MNEDKWRDGFSGLLFFCGFFVDCLFLALGIFLDNRWEPGDGELDAFFSNFNDQVLRREFFVDFFSLNASWWSCAGLFSGRRRRLVTLRSVSFLVGRFAASKNGFATLGMSI